MEQVEQIARQVRRWAKMNAKREDYSPDDLMGWCARASAELFLRLKDAGIKSEIHLHEGWPSHCFIVVDDHIVDVTATQFAEFKNKAVVILHQREAESYDFYQTHKVFDDVKKLHKLQRKTNWPMSQTVRLTGSYQLAKITA